MKFFSLIFVFAGLIFWPDGNRFDKSVGSTPTRQPYEVVDTVKLVSGKKVVSLNKHFTATLHNVVPSGRAVMFPVVTPLLYDTSDTPNSYGIYIYDGAESLLVKSSSATDTNVIVIQILMK